jgi:hypothetical protein
MVAKPHHVAAARGYGCESSLYCVQQNFKFNIFKILLKFFSSDKKRLKCCTISEHATFQTDIFINVGAGAVGA